MLKFWILSSAWFFFMYIGVSVIRSDNLRENFIYIFGEERSKIINKMILFDNPQTLILVSFIPVFNILYLIMYLALGFYSKDSEYIQLLKRIHEENKWGSL